METITIYCINHTCKLNKKCKRYAGNQSLPNFRLVKRFGGKGYKCSEFIENGNDSSSNS